MRWAKLSVMIGFLLGGIGAYILKLESGPAVFVVNTFAGVLILFGVCFVVYLSSRRTALKVIVLSMAFTFSTMCAVGVLFPSTHIFIQTNNLPAILISAVIVMMGCGWLLAQDN